MQTTTEVRPFQTGGGARIYQIPLEVFPGFWGYSYLVLFEEAGDTYRVLIDCGSEYGNSNDHLESGLQSAGELAGLEIHLGNLTHVLITHGHIDHFGGLSYVRPRTPARIGIHELDRRNLTNYEERLTVVARRLEGFLIDAGVSASRLENLLEMYKITKGLLRSIAVDFSYEAVGMQVGPFKFLHVPGHCAGQVIIRLHDVLFSGDHVLAGTSPHQAPEHLTLSTGLSHYLQSLDLAENWAGDVRLALGGHKEPVANLPARIEEIRQLHAARLDKVLVLLEEPHTIAEVSHALFGEVHGYNVLLALEEAGAHVEYLYQRGELGIENLAELENSHAGGVPILYRRISPDRPS